MPRNYAKIHTTIWSNEDFKSLSPQLQHAYFVLLSQPRLGMCGLLDYMPARIAMCCHEWTVEDVQRLMKSLEERRYIVIDHDTHELLVRTFLRNDQVLLSPNLTTAAVREYSEIMSEKLRLAVEDELVRGFRDAPDLPSWSKVKEANSVLFERVVKRVRS